MKEVKVTVIKYGNSNKQKKFIEKIKTQKEKSVEKIKQEFKEMSKKTVFLGGTCNGSTWRDELIPLLKINYFNPVVENWTPECQEEEIRQRENCDFCLYVITPEMTGAFAIAEIVDDSNKRPEKTIFYFIESRDIDSLNPPKNAAGYIHINKINFSEHQIKSLRQVGKMVEANGGFWAKSKEELLAKLNGE